VPAIPAMATAAKKAVKRDAPNMLIAAHAPNACRATLHSYFALPASAVTLAFLRKLSAPQPNT
jgi:hypothetical protein